MIIFIHEVREYDQSSTVLDNLIPVGLRVAKEDKHNNLLRGRLLKARSSTTSEDDKVSDAFVV